MYIAHNSRKLQPEKLIFGLFFEANARILARLVPNLTPELSCYLDYLRKIRDLLINYTSSSVFRLDHEHRFEVAELGTAWNVIDPTLSINLLKKKDSNPSVTTASRVASASTSDRGSSRFKSLVICLLFNQKDGCSYGANCCFQHVCNVEGCGLSHSAVKHVFHGEKPSNPIKTMAKLPEPK